MMVFTLAGKELRSLFLSPMAWSILAVVQCILAYIFLLSLQDFIDVQPKLAVHPNPPGLTSMVVTPLLTWEAILLLIISPLLTMRLLSEEARNQTLRLLFTAPISASEIVLGKFLGTLGFLFIILGLTLLMPLTLTMGGKLDIGLIFSGVMALILVVASFVALGLFVSSLTQQPIVAATISFGALLFLWLLDIAGKSDPDSAFAYISMLNHYQNLMLGVFSSSDIIYYLLFTASFLVLTVRKLDAQRWQS